MGDEIGGYNRFSAAQIGINLERSVCADGETPGRPVPHRTDILHRIFPINSTLFTPRSRPIFRSGPSCFDLHRSTEKASGLLNHGGTFHEQIQPLVAQGARIQDDASPREPFLVLMEGCPSTGRKTCPPRECFHNKTFFSIPELFMLSRYGQIGDGVECFIARFSSAEFYESTSTGSH